MRYIIRLSVSGPEYVVDSHWRCGKQYFALRFDRREDAVRMLRWWRNSGFGAKLVRLRPKP